MGRWRPPIYIYIYMHIYERDEGGDSVVAVKMRRRKTAKTTKIDSENENRRWVEVKERGSKGRE